MAVGEPGPIRAGADAPFGESASLERMAQARNQPAPRAGAGGPSLPPGGPPPGGTPAGLPELNNGYDAALFSPTDRPNEPITSGVPFGPGPHFTPTPEEDSRTFMLRVADTLSQTPELAAYVARVRAGG